MKFTEPIRKTSDFTRLYKSGRRYVGKYLILYASDYKPGGGNKLGATASIKAGKSVRRNRMRRLVKESYRELEPRVREGFILAFVVRAQNAELPGFHDVCREMEALLNRAGILNC